jgi:hypothetical protein
MKIFWFPLHRDTHFLGIRYLPSLLFSRAPSRQLKLFPHSLMTVLLHAENRAPRYPALLSSNTLAVFCRMILIPEILQQGLATRAQHLIVPLGIAKPQHITSTDAGK